MKVILREAAYADLDRIHAWIAKDNPRAAHAVIERILDAAELLGRHPYIGHAGRARGTYDTGAPLNGFAFCPHPEEHRRRQRVYARLRRAMAMRLEGWGRPPISGLPEIGLVVRKSGEPDLRCSRRAAARRSSP